MSFFTTNYCLNPSFQQGLLEYAALLEDEELFLDSSRYLYGFQSCRISAPGLNAGEGCSTAGGLIPVSAECSASIYIYGQGDLSVSAYADPGENLSGTFPVTLKSEWTRVVINGIPCVAGQKLYLKVYTTSRRSCVFWISGVQIEASSPAHPYCDGDEVGCTWLAPGPYGISVQEFQFPATASGLAVSTGNIVPVLDLNAVVEAAVVPGTSISQGNLVYPNEVNPVAAFNDFGIFELTDPDPAQTYVSWNSAGSDAGTGSTYVQQWASFFAPLDYIVSDGAYLWKRADKMAVGFQFASVPGSGTQTITDVMTQLLPMTTGFTQPAPDSFTPPRQLQVIVKPDRLNYCINPSFETSVADWTAAGTATLATDSTKSAGDIIEYDDVQYTAGTKSMKITLNASGDGAQISVPDLIEGDTYIASAYVQAGAGIANITIACGNGAGSASNVPGIPYGISGEYGDVPYGGVVEGGSDLETSTWFRPNCIFTAASSTETLSVIFEPGTDISYPAEIWVDAVLIEVGEVLSYYFDGNFGTNFFWEAAQNLSRSYYYDQFTVRSNAVINVLNKHTPLGISYATPIYSEPYTQ